MKRYIWVLCAALMAAACTDDAELQQPSVPEEEPLPAGVVEVPLTLTLGADWEVDAPQKRDVPPGQQPTLSVDGHAETENIDKVRVITFRRRNPDDIIVTSEADTAFIYDPSNDQTLDCNWAEVNSTMEGHDHEHKVATGTLRKVYGYEYRVVALAYSSSRTFADMKDSDAPDGGEENVFSFNLSDGLRFQDFKATVNTYKVSGEFLTGSGSSTHKTDCLNGQAMFVPQFFYGYCHTGNGNPIIPFAEDGGLDDNGNPKQVNNKPLTGLLYRGVAKVEVEIVAQDVEVSPGINRTPLWCALLGTNVQTEVGLTDYDDFLPPVVSVPEKDKGSYTALDRKTFDDGKVKLTAYVLPTKMKLGIRVRTNAPVTANQMRNGQIFIKSATSDPSSSAENATGIISTDVEGEDVFYFRRNHKYVFTGGRTDNIIENHPMD